MTAIDRAGCPATRHDTASAAHNHRCTCPDARDALYRLRKMRRADRSPHQTVDATGTRRRIQALQAIGWSHREIAARLGINERNTKRFTTVARVATHTHRRVDLVYRLLQGTPGPSATARRRAGGRGYPPPLLWEGCDIDDPAARPHDDTDTTSTRSRVDLGEVAHLVAAGESLHQIARRLGVTEPTVRHAWRRRSAA